MADYVGRKEYMREYLREWRAANPEKNKEYLQRYRDKNRDAFRAQSREQYRRNPKRAEEATRRWKDKHPERVAVYRAKRILAEAIGCRYSDVSDDLAEAKGAQLLVRRAIKEAGK